MAAAIPETEPIIRAAVQANPTLLAPDEGGISLRTRMQCLVYAPFKAAAQRESRPRALARGPFLIVLDGLDECDNKDEVQELIDGMLVFFNENPSIPLRVFITSRVEEHIHSVLEDPSVLLDNLVDHCSDDDIATFLHILFEDGCRRNSVIRAYVKQHGEWPTQSDRRKLVKHIGGSFIFASAVFKFIMASNTEANGPATPMDRLPLALKMNPGLDGLYTQTLTRSMHLPHFSNIISTVALLQTPLPTSAIAELLGIHTYEVVNVLVNLQAIIQVPGTDDIPVTLCHTSLRDFLTTPSRSGDFFASPSHHVRLFLRCLECRLEHLRQDPELFIRSRHLISTVARYALEYSSFHFYPWHGCFKLSDFDSAIRLCRKALALRPDTPELIEDLAKVIRRRGNNSGSFEDSDEAISLLHEALKLRPSPHPKRPESLNDLALALRNRYRRMDTMADLEEAIPLFREALELRPSPHPDRPHSLNNLGFALRNRYRRTGTINDLEEAISIIREALELQSSPHPGPDRPDLLKNLGLALWNRYRCTGTMADLEEAISLSREAVQLRPSPHPRRSDSLNNLGLALQNRYRGTGAMTDLEEAISLHREALELRPLPHPEHSESLSNLGHALRSRYCRTGTMADLEEAISLSRKALELRPSPHPQRSDSLNNLGLALRSHYRRTGTMADLEEAISLHREALELRPSPHTERSESLSGLGQALRNRYCCIGTMTDLEEAISLSRKALELRPSPHPQRSDSLNNLGLALRDCYGRTGSMADLEAAISLHREALGLQPSPHPGRSLPLYNLALSLQSMYKATHAISHLQEAIAHCEELLEFHHVVGHQDRAELLLKLGSLLQIATLREEAYRLSASSTESTT
ncbi:hypothetical protein EST38_g4140 [Candolleomyces aberdarensis]|uniref:Nephrocystin 3-like N-terminal domain-containing protein n=1 Tax=Candolleomyces aberdarensis TaxID=2316362 RepID=A0A4Q2DQJ9_9AGAR|nr:hypothetical protein EST38_g4140 [Candolleomyces aberdarensis]